MRRLRLRGGGCLPDDFLPLRFQRGDERVGGALNFSVVIIRHSELNIAPREIAPLRLFPDQIQNVIRLFQHRRLQFRQIDAVIQLLAAECADGLAVDFELIIS